MIDIQRLAMLSDKDLRQLEINATNLLNGPRDADAREMLEAIGIERSRRTNAARVASDAAAERIRKKVQNLNAEDRIVAAFTDLPPAEWESAAIRALHARPGATTEELSADLGYSGTYMNWFGHVCRDREPWLGAALPGTDGKVVYSALLVDFSPRESSAKGQRVTEWRLKPEAASALRKVGLI